MTSVGNVSEESDDEELSRDAEELAKAIVVSLLDDDPDSMREDGRTAMLVTSIALDLLKPIDASTDQAAEAERERRARRAAVVTGATAAIAVMIIRRCESQGIRLPGLREELASAYLLPRIDPEDKG
jgi:hypothetical protein